MSKLNNIKIEKNNRLHDIQTYDFKNLVFADPYEAEIKGSNPPVKYKKIKIMTKNEKTREVDQPGGEFTLEEDEDMPDSMGDLLFLMDEMFSFGVQEKRDYKSNKLSGYAMSLVLDDKDGASNRQLNTISQLEVLILECKKYLVANRKELKLPKLEMCDLKVMDKLIYKKTDEDGERVPKTSCNFTPKLIYQEHKDKNIFITKFYLDGEVDEEGNPVEVDPLNYLSDVKTKQLKLCNVRPVIQVDSIHIGSEITLQLKITEAIIRPVKSQSNTSMLKKQIKRK